jgi:protein pelota
MKLSNINLKEGSFKIVLENEEDVYRLYKFLRLNDIVGGMTSRRIKGDELKGSKSTREMVYLQLIIEKIHFYGFQELLRVSGPIESATDPSISTNSYHSIDMKLFQEYTVISRNRNEDEFSELESTLIGEKLDIVILIIDDENTIFYQLGTHGVRTLSEITANLPRKSSSPSQHQEALNEYFNDVAKYLQEVVDEHNFNKKVVGGPGFTFENFIEFLKEFYPSLLKNIHTKNLKSSGYSGILELLKIGLPEQFVGNLQLTEQTKLIDLVLEELSSDTGKITYGEENIKKAVEIGAVETLLVNDSLLHSTLEMREFIDNISKIVKNYNGTINFINETLPSVEILNGLGGIAALLRYSMDDFMT